VCQGGCGEASAWESVLLEAGTQLSLNLNGVLLINVSGRLLWGSLSLGICSSGGWNSALVKLKLCSYFSMYQGGCGKASTWESVLLEAGTELSFHTF
jgi:hypothetical protein